MFILRCGISLQTRSQAPHSRESRDTSGVQMLLLWKKFPQEAESEDPRAHSHWGETLQVRNVRTRVHRSIQPVPPQEEAPERVVRLQGVRQARIQECCDPRDLRAGLPAGAAQLPRDGRGAGGRPRHEPDPAAAPHRVSRRHRQPRAGGRPPGHQGGVPPRLPGDCRLPLQLLAVLRGLPRPRQPVPRHPHRQDEQLHV